MKAVLWRKYGDPDLLEMGKVEKPSPKADEVLIKIHAATVTPGDCEMRRFDMHILFWLPLRLYMGIFRPKRPILGMELAGEIEEVGSEVRNFKNGDHIIAGTGIGFGAYAEYKCVKASAFIALKPKNMDFSEAATIPTGANNALHYIRLAKIQKGQKILIIGAAGCFGTYAVQLAKMHEAEITAIDSTNKLESIRSLGADHVIDYTQEDFTENGNSYDVIFDIAGKNSVSKNMKSLKKGGRYILATPWVKQVLQGIWSARTSGKKFIYSLAKENSKDLEYIKELVEKYQLKAVIDKRFYLHEMAAAHKHVEKGDKIGHVSILVAQ